MLGMVASGASIAQGVPGNPAVTSAKAGVYSVEPHHTRVQFSVSHMGFTDWYGDFTGISGSLTLDPAHIDASKVDISIPVTSISTTNTVLDGELRSPAWFDAAQFPTMHFVSNNVVRTGERTAHIMGTLTFHGVSHPVTLEASFVGGGVNPMSKGYTVGFNATTTLHRSDFGVKTYVPMIGNAVDVRISAAFEAAH
ncbi:MAG: polyisoprenoid-binding protein [Alphaproteobacteria bacterium]|nr:polyisoprenoid-binding protein [Alphaproteobacteria bacterium]